MDTPHSKEQKVNTLKSPILSPRYGGRILPGNEAALCSTGIVRFFRQFASKGGDILDDGYEI
jgi:hypothetical protein